MIRRYSFLILSSLLIILIVLLCGCSVNDRIVDDIYFSNIYAQYIGNASNKVNEAYFENLYVDSNTLYIGGAAFSGWPTQAGHANEYLMTDGTVVSWNAVGAGGPHAATHTNGTDDIQDANAGQKGLMTAAYAGKLDGIEALADVTDSVNVDGAGALMNADADAKGDIFVATANDIVINLGIGNDDDVLTADSTEASGVKWAPLAGGGGITYKAGSTATDGNGDATVTFNTNMSDTNYAIALTPQDSADTIIVMYLNKAVGGFDIKTQDDAGKDEPNITVDWVVVEYYDP